MVFYPKSHFITTSYSPFPTLDSPSMSKNQHKLKHLTAESFRVENDLVSNRGYNGGYIVSANLMYRGSNLNYF